MKPQELLAGTRFEREEQVFAAPWEARAFAIARRMTEAGICTWDEFRACLIEEIGAADRALISGARAADAYYTHFLGALEKLLAKKGIVDQVAIEAKMKEIVEAG
jgi:nitrile hydratase accessory protein